MTPTLTLDAAQAARLRLDHYAPGPARSRRFRLDSEGVSVAVELPGPRDLAALLVLDGLDAFRAAPHAVAVRREGSEAEPAPLLLADLRAPLWSALAALPDVPGARSGYASLRLAAGTRSPLFAAYLDAVLAAWRRSRRPLPRPVVERAPGRPTVERSRDYRARKAAARRSSAAWALTMFLTLDPDDEDPRVPPAPGERVLGADLFAYASDLIENTLDEYAEAFDEDDLAEIREEYVVEPPADLVPVSRRALYAVAEEAGHVITRPGNVVTLTVRRAVKAVAHRLGWRDRPLRPDTEETLRSLGSTAKAARPRLAWRDRPLDPETEAALRGFASQLLPDDLKDNA